MAPLIGSPECAPANKYVSSSQPAPSRRKSVLYIDAYDSFSNNVVAMLEENLHVQVTVIFIDSEWPGQNKAGFLQCFEAVVLGPGPGSPLVPTDEGIMKDIWDLKHSSDETESILPVLGICLGFQSLCLHHGCAIRRLQQPLHGQIRRIRSSCRDIFSGLQDFDVTMYQSLYASVIDSSSGVRDSKNQLDILAWLPVDDNHELSQRHMQMVPMAVRHRSKPFWGVQFHPESCKSDVHACTKMLKTWWSMCLDFNELSGREMRTHQGNPRSLVMPSGKSEPISDATLSMLRWSACASETAACRSLMAKDLTAERTCESLNIPGSPTVLFRSNGCHSIISVPSPGSWRLEYYARTAKVLLESLASGKEHGIQCPTERTLEHSLSAPEFWESLRSFMDKKKVHSGNDLVPFWGGFLGFFSYEMGLTCLARPKTVPEMHGQKSMCPANGSGKSNGNSLIEDPPDASLLWSERSVVVDNRTGLVNIQSVRVDDDQWLDRTLQLLKELSRNTTNTTPLSKEGECFNMQKMNRILKHSIIKFPDEESYKRQVEACKIQLEAGESYELCLTCETPVVLQSPDTQEDRLVFSWELFKRLNKFNPAMYSAYVRLGNVKIISSSPECFLHWDRESMLELKPMKGTVKKTNGITLTEARKILNSPKEMAENLMIADLIRHDLYGICGSGGVYIEKLLEVEDHGRVFQMITHVKGQVKKQQQQHSTNNMAIHGITALQRCLPPGSMTGAPKERSCMHLNSIEGRNRGIYSGVLGYLDLGGSGSFSVLIRTAFNCSAYDERNEEEQIWRIGAGGAVTSLSSAEGEWDEMMTKLRTVCSIFKPLESGDTR